MLYKRYGNPAALLSSYTIPGLLGFFQYILKEENEDNLWQLWLHKRTEHADNFEKFKQATERKQKKAAARKRTARRFDADAEKEAIEKANQILGSVTLTNPGGNGGN